MDRNLHNNNLVQKSIYDTYYKKLPQINLKMPNRLLSSKIDHSYNCTFSWKFFVCVSTTNTSLSINIVGTRDYIYRICYPLYLSSSAAVALL